MGALVNALQKGVNWAYSARQSVADAREVISVNALGAFRNVWNGDKFPGGFGETNVYAWDYWTLRERSTQLFTSNLYARGLIRRLINNEINAGLNLEAIPSADFLGLDEDTLNEWSEAVEDRFLLWAKSPSACDFHRLRTFFEIQRSARLEALVEGDVLIVMRQHPLTKLPTIQLVRGSKIRTPIDDAVTRGRKIVDGVELDEQGRHVAFYITQDDGITSKRIPAVGPKSKRRIAWLMYGVDRRHGAVRGEPMLSLILQSLRELDRYRDSAQRKAVINSMIALFIKKTEDKPGTRPLTGGAVRRDQVTTATADADGGPRTLDMQAQIPGLTFEELQQGEEPVVHKTEADVDFPKFEEAVIAAVAWAQEIPPEILRLAFSSNYSASQAAINEFKMYLNRARTEIADALCIPVYNDWMLSQVIGGKVFAPGMLDAWRNPARFETFAAWVLSDWVGAIKPSADMGKTVKAYIEMIDAGLITRSRATREVTGMKFSRVARERKRENVMLLEADEPVRDAEAETNNGATAGNED